MKDFRSHLQNWTPTGGECLVIGEVAQAHDGSLGTAHAFIDAIAKAGADAVKFQTHIAEAESTAAEPWRVKFSQQDGSRFQYWRRMEFSEQQWQGLKEHANSCGLLFLSSPFSSEAVELLCRVGIPAWKVASGEMRGRGLLERMAATGLPILLSSGMSGWDELDHAVAIVRKSGVPFAVMQCTTAYPCPPEKIGLNVLSEIQTRYGCPPGLSDHSGTIFPALAAVTLGAAVVEVHVTLSREMFGPDVPASLTTSELKQLVEGIRFIERMKQNPVDKNKLANEIAPSLQMFAKSIVARMDLATGTILNAQHLALKKPGFGIGEERMPSILGRKLRRPLTANTPIKEEDLE